MVPIPEIYFVVPPSSLFDLMFLCVKKFSQKQAEISVKYLRLLSVLEYVYIRGYEKLYGTSY